ncbi:MAG TPA: murein biosynthesis integral membrane protein MurJ [Candidatus Limnocylindria bacterium]|nr:murein biosynthesis integral membrane protein MurJ [Candidatus Limnocylindria bacterium]
MSVARASVIMIVTLVASRFLGWLRLSVIGAQYAGDPAELDAFWAAFRIPDTLFNLLVAGALASAFIPVFAGYLAKEREEEGWHVASSFMNTMLVALVAFSAVMWLLAPLLVPAMVYGFTPDQQALTVDLTRVMLLSPIFMGLSSLLTGILQSYRQFLASAISPLVYNAVIILFALFAGPFLGITALAWGVVAGALMMFLVQVPELTFRRTRYTLSLDIRHPGVREIVSLAIPRSIALLAVQAVFIVDTVLASGMTRGSLTALQYAFQLLLLPMGVFSIAISAAVFPALSRYASLGQEMRLRLALQQAIRWILFLTVPTAIVMIVLRRPIVHLLFQYGEFGPPFREAVAAAFLMYSLGLVGHALVQILARAYYATKDTQTPLALTLISIGINIVLAVILAPVMGINGLALANAVATVAEAVLLFTLLAERARLRLTGIGFAMMKVLAASFAMGIAMYLFIRATNVTVDLEQTKLGLFVQTAIATAVGGAVYLVLSRALASTELAEIVAVVRERLGRGGGSGSASPA